MHDAFVKKIGQFDDENDLILSNGPSFAMRQLLACFVQYSL
jgi:hypothetical protein